MLDKYGTPDEVTPHQLVWRDRGPWNRIVATKAFHRHDFPTTHYDSVEGIIDYKVPPDKVTELAHFDGSVVVDRTQGELSARCHDEEANSLALNLVHDIVTGRKDVDAARQYYKQEFLDYRRGKPTPYMERLHFQPAAKGAAADPDVSNITDRELEAAKDEGKKSGRAA